METIAFGFGMFCGVIIASLFWLIAAKIIRSEVYSALIQAKNHQSSEEDADDSVNFWKPDGWKPDNYE